MEFAVDDRERGRCLSPDGGFADAGGALALGRLGFHPGGEVGADDAGFLDRRLERRTRAVERDFARAAEVAHLQDALLPSGEEIGLAGKGLIAAGPEVVGGAAGEVDPGVGEEGWNRAEQFGNSYRSELLEIELIARLRRRKGAGISDNSICPC